MRNKVTVFVLMVSLISFSSAGSASDSLYDAVFKNSTPHLILRYRFEQVDDDGLQGGGGAPLERAEASTLRTLLGFETGSFHDFSLTLDVENVTAVGSDDFNDGSNGKTQFATVVDPEGTELEQGFLKFTGIDNTSIKAGRQHLTYRKAPFHRFIGTILWRQNWQTLDAVAVSNNALSDTTIHYAYVWQVNRIFGSDASEPLSHFDSDSHFINLSYTGLPFGALEAYAYLLDFDNAAAFSSQTFGVRLNGTHAFDEDRTALYALEYASQSDYANNPAAIDADYLLAEGGIKLTGGSSIQSVIFKLSYEALSGNGGADRFVTILGTNHAYQGWADRFLITPGDGVEDIYGSFIMNFRGAKFIAAYHDYSSDQDSYDYGSEWNLLLSKTYNKRYSVGLKYADYDADTNATNSARNAAQSRDKSVFWAFGQFKY